jgi:hypothetical protein
VDISIESKKVGPVSSPSDTAVTVIAGVSEVANKGSITLGRLLEDDGEARRRRARSLQVLGKGTVGGMEADLLSLDFVEAAVVLENDTGDVAANGMEPYSVRPVVYTGADTHSEDQKKTIATLLWGHKGGILFDASDVEVKVTHNGVTHHVRWDWATPIDIYISITVTPMPGYTVDDAMKDEIRGKVEEAMNALRVGDDVRVLALYGAINTVAGVDSIILKLDTVDPPDGTTDIEIAETEVAVATSIIVS